MIIKFFELNKKQLKCSNFLLYGNNEGLIEETIDEILKPILTKNIYHYEEAEILKNIEMRLQHVFGNGVCLPLITIVK